MFNIFGCFQKAVKTVGDSATVFRFVGESSTINKNVTKFQQNRTTTTKEHHKDNCTKKFIRLKNFIWSS